MPVHTNIVPIDEVSLNDAINSVNFIEGTLPQLINLSHKEKLKHSGMKNKREPFVSKTIQIANQNPAVVPAFVSLPYLEEKYTNFQRLKSLEIVLRSMLEKVSDTAHNEGHFAYKEALKIFDSIEIAKDSNLPGIDSIHESLQQFFVKTKKQKATPEE